MFPLTVCIASHAFKPLYRMFVPWDDTPAGYNVWRGAVPRRKESGRLYEKDPSKGAWPLRALRACDDGGRRHRDGNAHGRACVHPDLHGQGRHGTGDTYVGRAEDYASRHPKAFGIQEPRENPTFSSDESNFEWTFKGTTYRYTYVRDLPSGWDGRDDAYSEAGSNEKGVSVSATLTTGYNDQIKSVDPCGSDKDSSGLGEYNIADIVLG